MKQLTLVFAIFIIASCTENSRVKNFGGEGSIDLPTDQKLVIVTWKDDNLWYLTKPMLKTDSAETYEFKEQSSWGVWNGSYLIYEHKTETPKEIVIPKFKTDSIGKIKFNF